MALKWVKQLSGAPLCGPGETCRDSDGHAAPCSNYMVNSVAISDDGTRVAAGTYYQNYSGTTRVRTDGKFGTYCYNTAGTGTRLWADEYQGNKGIYAVAISGDGVVAAGGGLLNLRQSNPFRPKRGLLRAFDVATGGKLLDTSDFSDRVNAVSLSGNGAVLAAVAESTLYVFLRSAAGSYATPPQEIDLDGFSQSVAVHPSGSWLAACDQKGRVYVSNISAGVVNPPAAWTAMEPVDPALPGSLKLPVKFNCVSVSRAGNSLAVGGGDFVYLLTLASLQASPPGPVARFSSVDAAGHHHNVRFVAISDDGAFVTTVVNDLDTTGNGIGQLIKLNASGSNLTQDWKRKLHHLPNSTSIDSSGTRITAADGYPDNVPGKFYLFDNTGSQLWEKGTAKMKWPMFISADGSGIAGGDDDNSLYFFAP